MRSLYNWAVAPLLSAGYRVYALRDEKAREFFALREGMRERLARDRAGLGPGARVVLFHVASVGELLMAMPVMAAVKARPGAPAIALSYTSPSVARNLPKGLTADLLTPSPLDAAGEVRAFLETLAPAVVVFSTYDLWPNFVWTATDRGVPLTLINATLPAGSGRLKFPARGFYRSLYSRLRAVGAITEADAERHIKLGVDPSRVRVTGNCRFDQTLARCRAVAADDPDLAALPAAEFTVVAGSTWPEDHRHLLPALAELLDAHETAAAVIAPHEPSPAHVAEVEDFFQARGQKVARFTRLRQGAAGEGARVMVVDTVGVLYKLYQKGQAAYVGGSFRQGVHSVMEPAGMGLPIIVGPVHKNSAEAMLMVQHGAATAAADHRAIAAALEKLVSDPAQCEWAGREARAVVEQNAGATGRTMALLEEFF